MKPGKRYTRPQITSLGSIADHTFMPITVGASESHKNYPHPQGDFECELSSSPSYAPGPGLCGTSHPGGG